MTSTQEVKKMTSMDAQKSHSNIPVEILKEARAEDKSVYGSDPETERDLLDTQLEGPDKDKDLPTREECFPEREERFLSENAV